MTNSNYTSDLQSGAGLAFTGGMLEALSAISGVGTLITIGTIFIPVGIIIIGFGLYERFFVSNLDKSSA